MEITAEQVRELREKTGAGIMDCKKALKESKGDFSGAMTYLREKGLASAQKKAGRTTSDGIVFSYIHAGGKVGVLVEMNCETDFVAKTEDFQTLTKDVAMHIAAMNPVYVRREDVPQDIIGKEREIYAAQARESGKPEKVLDKIVEGKLGKFFQDFCLMEQAFIKDSDVTMGDVITETVSKLGENIRVGRFARFKVGEGSLS
jgi:elongation factor Ts